MDRLLTERDIQDRLNVSRGMAWKLIYSGEIPHVKIGRCVRIRESDRATLIEKCRSPFMLG
jgi:excisionase family DNA binding protein